MNFEPIFGEDNEIIAFTDEMGNEWSLDEAHAYWEITGNSPYELVGEFDESWLDADALSSIGWGTDEDYGF